MTVTIAAEPWDAEDGERLRSEMQAELADRYGIPDQETEKPTAESVRVFLVARDGQGEARGCGALQVLSDDMAEIKRMYVAPSVRGTGVATGILRALEDAARELGVTTVVLSTGPRQPDAIRFYQREGYERFAGYGPYIGHPMAQCFTLRLTDA
ncbi:GNAT family N-acetyltransferase [Promicromonospora sp. NPDC052451]|uniref:GNAT family N-acetyltransferase n=1 Tax=Promicromonospora sp. NPDC052451 TaxID=3364407 RepID=UPI0037C840EB